MIDNATGAAVVLDVEHHEVHEGEHFIAFDTASPAAGASRDMLIVAPNTTVRCHMTFVAETDGKMRIYLYEAATVSATGAAITAYNNERNSAIAATLLVYSAPTVTAVGSLIWMGLAGSSSKVSGEVRATSEFILKQNTKYLLRCTAVGATVEEVTRLTWYEETGA